MAKREPKTTLGKVRKAATGDGRKNPKPKKKRKSPIENVIDYINEGPPGL